VDAMLLAGASEHSNGKVYNLGSHEVISLKALAEIMINKGPKGSYELVPFPQERKAIDIGNYYSDYSLINLELGWSPRVGLSDGLSRTIAYYAQCRSDYWQVTQ
jgi:dTDP-glucose 4,6-dehydratase/UDP-glucose 4-epimerase